MQSTDRALPCALCGCEYKEDQQSDDARAHDSHDSHDDSDTDQDFETWDVCFWSPEKQMEYLSPLGTFDPASTEMSFDEFAACYDKNLIAMRHWRATVRANAENDQWTLADVADIAWSAARNIPESWICQRYHNFHQWAEIVAMREQEEEARAELAEKARADAEIAGATRDNTPPNSPRTEPATN